MASGNIRTELTQQATEPLYVAGHYEELEN